MVAVSNQLAEEVARGLGAKYKLKPTRGCRNIKKSLPKEKTTLGQVTHSDFHRQSQFWTPNHSHIPLNKVYYGHADFGGFTATFSNNIARLFDYIIFGSEEYFFLGQMPEPLPQIDNVSYPLDTQTWTLLYVSLACTTIAFILIHKLHKVSIFRSWTRLDQLYC